MNNPLDLKTGDIVLFSGRCRVARLIQVLTLCKWSHVGMIIIDDSYDAPLVYESTHNDRVPGLDLGRKTQGVQIVKLSDRLEGYGGDMALMRLHGVKFSDNELYQLEKMRREFIGAKFEESYREAFVAIFKPYKQEENLSTIFCSELTAQAYIELGILPLVPASNNYTPADFAKRRVKLLRGRLSKPFMVKKYSK